jgi:predicted GIY-YIG superfamily endonuclease
MSFPRKRESSRRNGAITREKPFKRWERQSKLALIGSFNPEWVDLYDTLNG